MLTSPELETRLSKVLALTPEDIYDHALIRGLARGLASDDPRQRASAEADQVQVTRRLRDKFKADFATAEMKALIKAESAAFREQAEFDRKKLTESRGDNWRDQVLRKPAREDGSQGAVIMCEANAILYLKNHPEWAGVLGYNEFTSSHQIRRKPPEGITLQIGDQIKDHHETEFSIWFQNETHDCWRVEMIGRAIDVVARQNSFHPPLEWLNALPKWDKVNRLPEWLVRYCGVGPDSDADEDYPWEYVAAVGEKWWISLIARLYRPGCQVDHVLVLEGGEGLGKSSAVDIIANGWAGVLSGDIGSKDSQQMVSSGVWIWEWAELAAVKGRAMELVKDFISRRKENYRPPYGRRMVEEPRRCVFIATVNGDDYLDSSDGKRRWWPVRCNRAFDLEGLRTAVPLLMAEALAKFNTGAKWHFDAGQEKHLIEAAKAEQAARVPESVNDASFVRVAHKVLGVNLEFPDSVSVEEVFNAFTPSVNLAERKKHALEVGRALRAAGWTLYKPRHGKAQVRRWQQPQ